MQVERIDLGQVRELGAAGVADRVRSLVAGVQSVEGPVREIVSSVRKEGDTALLALTSRLDLAGAEPMPLLVGEAELDEAIVKMPRDVVAGLQVAIANVSEVAQAGVGRDEQVRLPQGHSVTLREIPVDSAAVYVPGGRAPYPSTAVMGVVTARSAGVLDVCVCAPPRADGNIDPMILGTCRLLGVQRVYRMGGPHAIAALAYGTQTVRRVDVIVGPGNLYVQEAKRQVSGDVGIDGIAGPSDLVVVCGAEADPRLVALDVLAQAEHGEGSLVAAISHEDQVLDAVTAELQALLAAHPGLRPGPCATVCCESAGEAVTIAEQIAPEHLELIGLEVEALAPMVRHAGCLFVGASSATAFGDYVAGSNHILPTGGAARFSSVLNAACFRRRMAEVRIEPASAAKLASAGAPIAEAEGFAIHAESMRARAAASRAPGGESAPGGAAPGGAAPGGDIGENRQL